jgi:hypothetical protein
MKVHWRLTITLFSCILTTAPVLAQTPARLDSSLVNYFTGEWTGEGHFSNGNPIAATVAFHLALDSAWLICDHHDRPPHQYKATSYWGSDAGTGQFVALNLDNFHGHRSFGSRGWSGGRLVLTAQGYYAGVGTYFEHFIYQRLSDAQFRMTYETSGDGITWKTTDSLVFTRRTGAGH